MDATFLRAKHESGLPYDAYVRSGAAAEHAHWQAVWDRVVLTEAQRRLLGSFTRRINVLVLSGLWCGDCAQQGPLIDHIARANPDRLAVRWLDRDQHADLQEQVRINGGRRVPVLLFCAEDYELVCWFGDRTLSRYRSIARQALGASCPLPSAPVDQDELSGALADWVDQFERVHLVLRLSPRWRQVYGD